MQARKEHAELMRTKFKEENAKAICWINVFSTVATIILAAGTLSILNTELTSCSTTKLRLTLWIMLGMHCINVTEAICNLTYLDKIFCGCLCVIGFFVYELAALNYMLAVFVRSSACAKETPYQYYWLLVNLVVYFGFVALAVIYHIKSLCGSSEHDDCKDEPKE
jgi:hypothetical protein